MANCKNLKIKLNHKLECKLTKKIITWEQCKNCKLREYNLNNISIKKNDKHVHKKTKECIKKEIRDLIHNRDNHICQMCHEYGNHLHHIIARQERPDLTNDPNNIITLCFDCHINKVTNHEKDFEKLLQEKIKKMNHQ